MRSVGTTWSQECRVLSVLCCSDGLVLGLHIVMLESYVGPANTDVKLTPSHNLTWAYWGSANTNCSNFQLIGATIVIFSSSDCSG